LRLEQKAAREGRRREEEASAQTQDKKNVGEEEEPC
jgi:hypothetical protein